MDRVELINLSATLTTILQFAFPLLSVLKVIKDKSTKNVSCASHICGILSCSLWLLYGILKDDWSIKLVNAFGSVCFSFYIIVYYIYTVKKKIANSFVEENYIVKKIIIRQITVCKVIIISFLIYSINEQNKEFASVSVGVVASSVTILFFASPMLMVFRVLRTKSTECLPYSFIFLSFLVSLQWLIYGILIDDVFVKVPNIIGSVISVFQLSLFLIYPNTRDKNAFVL